MTGKLTEMQAEMVALCIEQDYAWLTSATGTSAALLAGWVGKGWAVQVEPPATAKGTNLVAYRITEAGRTALREVPHE